MDFVEKWRSTLSWVPKPIRFGGESQKVILAKKVDTFGLVLSDKDENIVTNFAHDYTVLTDYWLQVQFTL